MSSGESITQFLILHNPSGSVHAFNVTDLLIKSGLILQDLGDGYASLDAAGGAGYWKSDGSSSPGSGTWTILGDVGIGTLTPSSGNGDVTRILEIHAHDITGYGANAVLNLSSDTLAPGHGGILEIHGGKGRLGQWLATNITDDPFDLSGTVSFTTFDTGGNEFQFLGADYSGITITAYYPSAISMIGNGFWYPYHDGVMFTDYNTLTYSATLALNDEATNHFAGLFQDPTNTVSICDGVNAINATGKVTASDSGDFGIGNACTADLGHSAYAGNFYDAAGGPGCRNVVLCDGTSAMNVYGPANFWAPGFPIITTAAFINFDNGYGTTAALYLEDQIHSTTVYLNQYDSGIGNAFAINAYGKVLINNTFSSISMSEDNYAVVGGWLNPFDYFYYQGFLANGNTPAGGSFYAYNTLSAVITSVDLATHDNAIVATGNSEQILGYNQLYIQDLTCDPNGFQYGLNLPTIIPVTGGTFGNPGQNYLAIRGNILLEGNDPSFSPNASYGIWFDDPTLSATYSSSVCSSIGQDYEGNLQISCFGSARNGGTSANIILMGSPVMFGQGIIDFGGNNVIDFGHPALMAGAAYVLDWSTGNALINNVYYHPQDNSKLQVNGDASIYDLTNLGTEKITSYNDFTNGAWTRNSPWTLSGTRLNKTTNGTGTTTQATMASNPVIGETYSLDIEGGSYASNVTVTVGGTSLVLPYGYSAVRKIFVATSTAGIVITPDNTFNGYIASISLKKILGGNLKVAGNVTVQGLSALSGIYTDAIHGLTTTPPTSGTLGYWSRTSTFLNPATAGDKLAMSIYEQTPTLDYTSVYPIAFNSSTCVATSDNGGYFYPWFAVDPSLNVNAYIFNCWLDTNATNQRFGIDLNTAKKVERIYIENLIGGVYGVKNFTFWGANSPSDFANGLDYPSDATMVSRGWTKLTTSPSIVQQRVIMPVSNPQYFAVTNSNSYRYYCFKFADCYNGFIAANRITLQIKAGTSTSKISISSDLRRLYDSAGNVAVDFSIPNRFDLSTSVVNAGELFGASGVANGTFLINATDSATHSTSVLGLQNFGGITEVNNTQGWYFNVPFHIYPTKNAQSVGGDITNATTLIGYNWGLAIGISSNNLGSWLQGVNFGSPTNYYQILFQPNGGNVGIGITDGYLATARLHLPAGTTAASSAPLKLTSGTNMTTAEVGAVEYDGTRFFATPTGTLRERIPTGLNASCILSAGTSTTVTVSQAKTTSNIFLQATSASATALGAYISAKNNGSFVITTVVSAIGTETMDYLLIN